MRKRFWSRLLHAGLAVACVLGGRTLFEYLPEGFGVAVGLYVLSSAVFFTDFLDFVLRLFLRRAHGVSGSPSGPLPTSIPLVGNGTADAGAALRPYAIVVSVHNAEASIEQFLEAMHAFRDRCWIIDDASTDNTVQRIRHAGWRCIEGVQNRKKPGAIRRLLHALPPELETIVVVDPDISLDETGATGASALDTVVMEFQRSGHAAVSPRLAVRPDSMLQRCQALEYGMSFSLGRMSLGDAGVISGISLYRRQALTAALEQHSLSVYAEDLENAVLLLGAGERIYYDSRLVVATEVPASFSGWFSQRVGWSYGLIKVYVERFDDILRVAKRRPSAAYQFIAYLGILCIAMQPIKIVSLLLLTLSFANGFEGLLAMDVVPDWSAADPIYFAASYCKYLLLSVAAVLTALPRGERSPIIPILPLYFFYALLQILPTTIGYANWITLRTFGGRVFADHYQDEHSIRGQQAALSGRVAPAGPVTRAQVGGRR